MNIRPHRKIVRKKTREITVGNVTVGGDSKISVQSMTNSYNRSKEYYKSNQSVGGGRC